MKRNGFSLVELITVMAIIGTLLTIATLSFNTMSLRAGIDSQTRTLFTDLMDTRLRSLYRKKSHFVTLATGTYIVYSSGTRTTPRGQVLSRTVKYPITWNGNGSLIEFDLQGLTNDLRSVCVSQADNPATLDSIVISTARTNLGERKANGTCSSDDIQIK